MSLLLIHYWRAPRLDSAIEECRNALTGQMLSHSFVCVIRHSVSLFTFSNDVVRFGIIIEKFLSFLNCLRHSESETSDCALPDQVSHEIPHLFFSIFFNQKIFWNFILMTIIICLIKQIIGDHCVWCGPKLGAF